MTKFKFRGFTSLLMFFSFLISLISGIVLYFPPQGKIAHWTHWAFLSLDKDMWGALHINSSLVFFIIALVHLYYNWKVILRYIKKKSEMAFNIKYELITAFIISIFIIVATIFNIEPFRTIIRWNDDIKNFWAEQADVQPPTPHAENLSVSEFCDELDIPISLFQQRMNQKGWEFNSAQDKISDIAKRNGISPATIYNSLTQSDKNRQGDKAGGWGRKSLNQVCNDLSKDVDVVINKLAAKGIHASGHELIKNIATEHNLRPVEIVEMINGF